MPLDVVDLRNFYGQALGRVARRFVGRGIRARWQDVHGLRVVGIGYPSAPTLRDTVDIRARDLAPTAWSAFPGSGGADRFGRPTA